MLANLNGGGIVWLFVSKRVVEEMQLFFTLILILCRVLFCTLKRLLFLILETFDQFLVVFQLPTDATSIPLLSHAYVSFSQMFSVTMNM